MRTEAIDGLAKARMVLDESMQRVETSELVGGFFGSRTRSATKCRCACLRMGGPSRCISTIEGGHNEDPVVRCVAGRREVLCPHT